MPDDHSLIYASVATPGSPVALTATMYNFDVQLSDVDRHVYETLAIRAARHPSETEEFLSTRVLAYCLEFADGIDFGRGLSEPDEPALAVRDLTGALRVWIDVGSPDAARLHRASKAAPRTVVYTYKDPAVLARQLAESADRIHRADAIEIRGISRLIVDALVGGLERRTQFGLAVTDGHLYLTIDGQTVEGAVTIEKPVQSG